MSLQLKVVTPEKTVIEATVEAVYADAADGQIGILSGHVPLLTNLKVGILRFQASQKQESIALMGGILETDGKNVTVLANAAEKADEIDALRAEEAKKRSEVRLKESQEKVDINRAQMSLARALTRLKLLEDIRRRP